MPKLRQVTGRRTGIPTERALDDRVDPATTALIVVDMQNDFCSADGYYATVGRDISKLAAAIAPVAALLERARQSRSDHRLYAPPP